MEIFGGARGPCRRGLPSRHCSELDGLGKLAREKAAFQALSGFAPDASNGACVCILAASSGRPEMSGLEGMLRSIADRGNVAISRRSDPRAELVSVHNVGAPSCPRTRLRRESRRRPGAAAPTRCWWRQARACGGCSPRCSRARFRAADRRAPRSCHEVPAVAPSMVARDREGAGVHSLLVVLWCALLVSARGQQPQRDRAAAAGVSPQIKIKFK